MSLQEKDSEIMKKKNACAWAKHKKAVPIKLKHKKYLNL